MNQNPYQSPEEAEPVEATAAALKPPIVLIAFQGIMVVAAVLMYLFWFPHLNDAYLTNGLGLPAISKHLLSNPFGYLTFGVLVANGLFAARESSSLQIETVAKLGRVLHCLLDSVSILLGLGCLPASVCSSQWRRKYLAVANWAVQPSGQIRQILLNYPNR